MRIDIKPYYEYEKIFIDGLYEGVLSEKDGKWKCYLKFRDWDAAMEFDTKEEILHEINKLDPLNDWIVMINISSKKFLEHLSFWYEKSDDECIALATNECGVDAEQALKNILERDFCKEISNEIVKELKQNENE